MKLDLLKSRVLNLFIEACADSLNCEIHAAKLISLLQEKNLILNSIKEKQDLGKAVLAEVPNLITGLSRARTKLISAEGYRLKTSDDLIEDVLNHLPYLRSFKALSA